MSYQKLRYDRVLSSHRKGNGSQFQMFGGQTGSPLSDPASGDFAVYDANGNVVAGGLKVSKAGTLIGTRPQLNLVEGANVTLSVSDDSVNHRVNCTIASSGGGGGGSLTVGPVASLPASPASSGEIYRCTDSLYEFVGTGSPLGWQAFHGPWPVTPPLSSGWSWDNQESATVDSTNGYEYLYIPRSTLAHLSFRYRTAPSTPYFIQAGFLWNLGSMPPGANQSARDVRLGLFFRDGDDGKIIAYTFGFEASASFVLQTYRWTNSTTRSTVHTQSLNSNQNYILVPTGSKSPLWLGIADDGSTNLKFYWSIDRQHWELFDTWAREDFMTGGPTQVGFGGYNGDGPQWQALIHWKEGTTIP